MITIPASLARRIREHMRACLPEECCGLLVGTSGPGGTTTVSAVAESDNIAAGDRTRTFEVDPALRLSLMRRGDTIVGHYHSHPGSAAEPSATDLGMAFEPELVWLIVSPDAMRAFQPDPDGKAFREIPLIETQES